MPIRLATYNDLLPASRAAASAFMEEELFGPVMHPNRHAYPSHVYLSFLKTLRKKFFDPRAVILVSHPASSCSSITGVAIWIRQGPGGAALGASQTWVSWIAERLVPLYNYVEELVWPNYAADPAETDILNRAFPHIRHHWLAPGRTESWYLSLLGTADEFQGQGYGREMVRWGLQRAREEGVAGSVVAALGKDGFYRRCGFGDVVGWASEGEGNPLSKVPGGGIMFMDVEKK